MRHILIASLTASAIALAGCTEVVLPEPDPLPDVPEISTVETDGTSEGVVPNSFLKVTLSCRRGNLPGQDVQIMPINAYVAVVDEGYREDLMAAIQAGSEEKMYLDGETGEDGLIGFTFREDREYKVVVLPRDDRFETVEFNVSNFNYNKVMVPQGETAEKNFVLTQAYCDKDLGGIRPIGLDFQVPDPAYTADYEKTSLPFPNPGNKQIYWRSSSLGPIGHKYASTMDFSARSGFYLAGGDNITITNVHAERYFERKCFKKSLNIKMTFREDHAMGIQHISGTIGDSPFSCARSYATYLPVTYETEPSGNFEHSSQNLGGLLGIGSYPVYKNGCNNQLLANALGNSEGHLTSCNEIDATSISVHIQGALNPASVNTRVDVGEKEESEGKVP